MPSYPAINIQWPISEKIITGEKSIETRTYPLPTKYRNQDMLMIETPGQAGKFKARIVAKIKFTDCFQYHDRAEFYADYQSHRVDQHSPWAWRDKPKFGWRIKVLEVFSPALPYQGKKGIVFTSRVVLPPIASPDIGA